jgi:hypothetical protein
MVATGTPILYAGAMPKRSSKPRDLNQLAAALVHDATSDEPEQDPYEGKNPAAVELGRLGGRKGGKVRAARLTAEQRSEAAKRAARARWKTSE